MRRNLFKPVKVKWRRIGLISTLLGGLAFFGINATRLNQSSPPTNDTIVQFTERDHRRMVEQYLSSSIQKNQYIPQVNITRLGVTEQVRVLYTFDFQLQRELDALMHQYDSDYSSVVVMDPATGRIIAMASYEAGQPSKENWALKATFPAASIFKIVTASAAIDKYKISPEMEMGYTGANYKLYKRDLFNENERWARNITFKEAFAKSINIFFGKLALKVLLPDDLMTYAGKFYFNKDLAGDVAIESSKANLQSHEPFHVAEVASGFNSMNTLSPVHGALIASAVVNDGVMQSPYMVQAMLRKNGTAVYRGAPYALYNPITAETARQLRSLMNETVEHGTSRKAFRELTKSNQFSIVEAGGKTGTLTGTNPAGKTDWFVGYARLGTRMMAVSVVNVNKTRWKVKSSYLAQRLIKAYFKEDVTFSTAHVMENQDLSDN